MERLRFTSAMTRVVPPWLRRTVGARLMESLGEPLDDLVDRLVASIELRFPGVYSDESLPLIGRERRIRRGPGEPAETYARRLLPWWDDHRGRGGPYAMLRQLYAYFLDSLNVRMDIVYHSGTRRWIDEDGAITRDAIEWNADGTDEWAHIWVFFYLGADGAVRRLVTLDGDPLITLDGDSLVTLGGIIASGTVSEADAENFRAIPREWSAAHIPYVTIVLLYDGARLWGYPQPVPEWGAPGAVWQSNNPVQLIAE